MILKENVSYSRYRGIDDSSRYDAVDDYFKYYVDGNLICTDNEMDINHDGNIILITPDGDVAHIGFVPTLEEGAGKPRYRMDQNGFLHCEYRIFLDNDHHHSDIVKEVIDCHLTDEYMATIRRNKVILYLSRNLKAARGCRISYSYSSRKDTIEMHIRVNKPVSRWRTDRQGFSLELGYKNGMYISTASQEVMEKAGRYHLFETDITGSDRLGFNPVDVMLEKYYAKAA